MLAARNEEQFYNTSSGSSEITAQGFPAAFFPRKFNGKTTFMVVFPVRTVSTPSLRNQASPLLLPGVVL